MSIFSVFSTVKIPMIDHEKLSRPTPIYKKPFFLISSAVVLGLTMTACVLRYRSWQNSLEQTIIRYFNRTYPNLLALFPFEVDRDREAERLMRNLLDNHWWQLEMPECCRNGCNRDYLVEKLLMITTHQQTVEDSITIALNVIRDFKNFLTQSVNLIQNDLVHDHEFREIFGIVENPVIITVEILGEESHLRRTRGNNPLKIVFGDGIAHRMMIFKPRSMISERWLCHTEGSVFALLDLPTYKIYDKEGQNYGYCEFLRNENTFSNRDQIRKLLLEHGKIERVAQYFGLEDLHSENVFLAPSFPNRNPLKRGHPHLTDTEVILSERNPFYNTHYLLYTHDAGAWGGDDEGSNLLYLTQEFAQEIHLNVEDVGQGLLQILHCLEEDLQVYAHNMHLQNHPALNEIDQGLQNHQINDIRDLLRLHHHRIVILDTGFLRNCLRRARPEARALFLENLQDRFQHLNWIPLGNNEELLQQFDQDVEHNDVPIFYHFQNEIYYGGHRIAAFPPLNVIDVDDD